VDSEPDYRFTLANERTFLAYVRTTLALDGAGLAVVQFFTTMGNSKVRTLLGGALVVGGLITALAGFARWRSVEMAMRRRAPLPRSWMPALLTVVIGVASLIAAISLILR
jgi:putative membrane protein